jgi:drug/metabolite transporter (DMT)-like permease
MIGGGVALAVMAAVTGEPARIDAGAVSLRSLSALVYLTLIGSLVGYSTYAWLLSAAPVSTVSTYAYVNPVVAVILGALVLQEPITLRTLVAGAIIVGAVALIISARGRLTRAGPAPEDGAGEAARQPSASKPAHDPRATTA